MLVAQHLLAHGNPLVHIQWPIRLVYKETPIGSHQSVGRHHFIPGLGITNM